jgi:hypothetical protein
VYIHLHVAYNISFSAQAFAQCTARGEERRGEERRGEPTAQQHI